MTRHVVALAVVAAMALAGCSGGEEEPIGAGQVMGQQAVYGRDDPGAGAACFLAADAADVARLWDLAVAGNVVGDAPAPPADFRAPVVGVFLGQRPSGGYGVAVRNVGRTDDGGVRLEIATTAPAPGEVTVSVITSPYVLYVLPDDTTEVLLVGDVDVPCQARVPELPAEGDPGRVEEESS